MNNIYIIDNEGLIGRERQDHHFGYLRASIFRRLQADLGLLLAAFGAQQRDAPAGFSFLPQGRAAREGGVVSVTSRYT